MNPGRYRTFLKVALSLGLLGVIVAYSGPRELLATLRGMGVMLVVLAFGLALADALIRTLNWYQLGHSVGCALPLGRFMHAYFAGGFIGALLPTTLGTDMARSAIAASRSKAPLEVLFASTVLLNVMSLAVICIVGLGASIGLLREAGAPRQVLAASAGVAVGLLFAIALLDGLRTMLGRRAPHGREPRDESRGLRRWFATLQSKLDHRLARFMSSLRFRPGPGALASVSAVALVSFGLRTLGWLALLAAAGASVPWTALLAIGPLVTLGALLPISVLGFGGFQAINVYLLGFWGVPAEQALAASLIHSGLAVLLHAIGCGAWLSGGREPLTAPVEPGLQYKES